MAQAVHFFDRIASAATTSSSTLTPIQTITAAELAAAGFNANDDVLIVWFFRTAAANNTPHHWASILYNSTELMWDPVWGHLNAPGNSGIQRTYMFMERVNLGGTVGDIVTRHRTDVAASVTTHHSEVLVIRLADFGTEGVHWHWDKSTTTVQNTTTYSATDRAAVTWTPGSVQDWVYLAQAHTAIDDAAVNAEGRVTFDSVPHSGDWTFEGNTTFEELSLVWFGRLNSLSQASHTLAVETRDDSTGVNDHRNSRLFVFRKDVWPDLFTDTPGSVDVSTTGVYVANQVATVTDTLSVEQPLVMFGNGYMGIGFGGQAGHFLGERKWDNRSCPRIRYSCGPVRWVCV